MVWGGIVGFFAIRRLARDPMIQLRFQESKRSGLPFFDVKCAVELNEVQSLFLHWAGVYDWAFTLPINERPADHIIQDDSRFDVWLKGYVAHQNSAARSAGRAGRQTQQHSNVFNNFD